MDELIVLLKLLDIYYYTIRNSNIIVVENNQFIVDYLDENNISYEYTLLNNISINTGGIWKN